MKQLIILILLFFITFESISQNQNISNKIFNNSQSNVNQHFSIDGSTFYIKGETTGTVGGTFGLLINKSFSIGITGSYINSSNNEPVPNLIIPPQYTDYIIKKYFWYSGIQIEPIVGYKSRFHLSFPMSFGVGQRSYRIQETNEIWTYYAQSLNCETFLYGLIGIHLESNLATNVKFAIGPSFMYTTNLPFLRAPRIALIIKIGKY